MNTVQPRDSIGRFISRDNTKCVPVPVEWIKRLVSLSSKVYSINNEVNYLKGFVESAEGFLEYKTRS